jgi:hypothetical protein
VSRVAERVISRVGLVPIVTENPSRYDHDVHSMRQGRGAEGPFAAHFFLGFIIIAAMLILFLLTVAGRLGRAKRRWSGGLLALGLLQIVFAEAGFVVPAVGALHPVNALAIFAVSGTMAHRAWVERSSPALLTRAAPTQSG